MSWLGLVFNTNKLQENRTSEPFVRICRKLTNTRMWGLTKSIDMSPMYQSPGQRIFSNRENIIYNAYHLASDNNVAILLRETRKTNELSIFRIMCLGPFGVQNSQNVQSYSSHTGSICPIRLGRHIAVTHILRRKNARDSYRVQRPTSASSLIRTPALLSEDGHKPRRKTHDYPQAHLADTQEREITCSRCPL